MPGPPPQAFTNMPARAALKVAAALGPSAPVDIDADANTLLETAAVGSQVQIDAYATDPGGGSVEYYFKNANGARVQTLSNFTIDAVTGVVTLATALDYEIKSSHSLTIYAANSAGGESSSVHTVTVTDVQVTAVSSKVFVEEGILGRPTRFLDAHVSDGTSPTNYQIASVDGTGVSLTDAATGQYNFFLSGWNSFTFVASAYGETSAPATVTLHRGAGDTFIGTAGNDEFYLLINEYVEAGAGNDIVHVSYGESTLIGGAGEDWLMSVFGHGTTFDGGGDADVITLTNPTQFVFGGGTHDTDTIVFRPGEVGGDLVYNFEAGSGNDVLQLQGFGSGAYLTNDGFQWQVHYGDGQVETFTLDNVTSLAAGDFWFS